MAREKAREKAMNNESPKKKLGREFAKIAKGEVEPKSQKERRSEIERVLDKPIFQVTKTSPPVVFRMPEHGTESGQRPQNNSNKTPLRGAARGAEGASGPKGFKGPPANLANATSNHHREVTPKTVTSEAKNCQNHKLCVSVSKW